jgi:hypothetical protein
MSAYIKSYGIFNVELISIDPIDNKQRFMIWINNTTTSSTECLDDYCASPMSKSLSDICDDAMNMITAMAIEWHEDNRDDDPIFQEIYNKLSNIMTYRDIENIYCETLRD